MNTKTNLIKQTTKLIHIRSIFTFAKSDNSSKELRKRFLDFFITDNNHQFIRSSPVVPHHDNSLAFVNAGMNQFKGIFLGKQKPKFLKVANSQKCIRAGGKHNDISIVGSDCYHHTFFEMLGNWSFGDYFKKEACQLAWRLLTEVYKIDPKIMYVTYFAGENSLNLNPDYECREIWRSIGVSEDRILPFGMKDNFWEMGLTGPCGPCSEIHVDFRGKCNRAQFVNKGLPDLQELWNIVFIQFLRNPDNSIVSLPTYHIDTGMGLERLCSLMQGKLSNYDTDLFSPLFVAIHKICKNIPEYSGKYGETDWNLLDTNYRILVDHARMITACLADGVIPEQNQKLRKIMRKVFSISEGYFNVKHGLLKELTNYVVEKLGTTYPEMEKNIKTIHKIIDHEEEIYSTIRNISSVEWKKIIEKEPELSDLDIIEMPGIVAAYKELKFIKNELSPQMSFKLFDTYGLDQQTISKLTEKMKIKFDPNSLKVELQKARTKSLQKTYTYDSFLDLLRNYKIQTTNDSYKYDYVRKKISNYEFTPLKVKVLKIIKNGKICSKVEPNEDCAVILNKSNFYTDEGGQSSDKGVLEVDGGYFKITEAQKVEDFVLHIGMLQSKSTLKENDEGLLKIDDFSRLNNMRNHTATHLLNSSLKRMKSATCQKSSKVTPEYLNLDVCIFGSKLTSSEIENIEKDVNSVIKDHADVNIKEIDSQVLLSLNDVTMIPGEIYPEVGIRLVEIKSKNGFLSREPCCGTHVLNTADLEDFCIIKVQSLGRNTTSIYAVTNGRAEKVRNNGRIFQENILQLQRNLIHNIETPEILKSQISSMNKILNCEENDPEILPVVVKNFYKKELQKINKQIEEVTKSSLKKFIEEEMLNVVQTQVRKTKTNQPYIVHYLRCSTLLDNVPLQNATKVSTNIPTIVISYSDSSVKARCCVPKSAKNENFNAEKWLSSSICSIFKSTVIPTSGQDLSLVCNMRKKKINIKDWDSLLKQSLELATEYVEKYL